MVGFVIVVALINVCVGYGLAVCFGYGPPGLWAAWIALGPYPAAGGAAASRKPVNGLTQQIVVGPRSTPAARPADLGEQHAQATVLKQDPLTGLPNRTG